jgi:inositol 1,4,5-triphosphate receptor type 1
MIRLLCSQLLDVVHREETLLNVIKSVTRNGRSIVLTAVLALILVYLFSIIGYVWFKDDFLVTVEPEHEPGLALEADTNASSFESPRTSPFRDVCFAPLEGDASCEAAPFKCWWNFRESKSLEEPVPVPVVAREKKAEDDSALKSNAGGEETKERACDSLIMCIVTTLNQGLRNGGGIGDVLRPPSSNVSQS